jgi:hypothetical protein
MSKAEFRIGSLLPLLLVICSWQISATAIAQTATIAPDGSAYSSGAAISSADKTDCTAAEKEKNQPSRDSNNSPEPARDIDESEGGPAGLEADSSSRNDQDTSPFSVTGFDAVTLRAPGTNRIPLLPVNCFPCLHEHIRERAPPIPV